MSHSVEAEREWNRGIVEEFRANGGEERGGIWERQKRLFPNFANYEAGTSRRIPVVILEPETAAG